MRIAYPGAEGSYTEEAAALLFPDDEPAAVGAFEDAAAEVVERRADRAVLPIENSLAGLVPDTLIVLEDGTLSIVAEAVLHIPHCLIGVPGSTPESVRVVHSHPMALAQCRRTLNGRYERVGASTTGDAARHVAALADTSIAAIASPLAARRHGLEVLLEDVSDHPENLTRFVALAAHSRLDRDAHHDWHTALRFGTSHLPGALHDVIEPFRYHRLQMTSLHSRPIMGQPWRYQFYVDLEGHRGDERVRRALTDVAERASFLEVLGSYPVQREPQRAGD